MSLRRFLAATGLLALLCACRGSSGGTIPATGPAALQRGAMRAALATAGIPAISFKPLGPTHMTSGGTPNSGKVNAYAVDPKNPNLIYLASGRGTGLETYSSAGIYRTSNGGKSWQPVMTGLNDTSGLIASVVNTLWIDPAQPATLLAGTEYDGIYRSRNGGASWSNVYPTTQATQFQAIGSTLYATSAAGVLASNDDGATWSISLAGVQPTAFAAVSAKAGTPLYTGTTLGVVEVLQGGKWRKMSTLPFTAHTGTQGSTPAVHQMAADPFAPTHLYASTNDGLWDQELFGSVDGGKTWVSVAKKAAYQDGLGTQAIAFSLVHPHRLYIGLDGGFLYINDPGASPQLFYAATLSVIDVRDIWVAPGAKDDTCFVASDQGLDKVPSCSASTQDPQDNVVSSSLAIGLARHFAISPTGSTLFVSLQDFDSHISFNGGASWTETQFYEDGFNELRPGNPNYCYVLDEAYGLSVSSDGCRFFPKSTPAQAAIVPSRLMATPIAFDPKNPLSMYLLSGPVEAPGINGVRAVYHTSDGGVTFTKERWPFVHAGTIIVDARNGEHIVVSDLKSTGSSISTTFDGGATWKVATGVPHTAFWYTASISPANSMTVLASSVDASANVYVLRSTDGGLTFTKTQVVTSAPALAGRIDTDRKFGAHGRAEENAGDSNGPPAAFLYSPSREIRYNQDKKSGIADAVLTTLRGAYISVDDGLTWHRVDIKTIAHSFWGARWRAGYLYLGSDGQGLLRSQTPVQAP